MRAQTAANYEIIRHYKLRIQRFLVSNELKVHTN